MRKYLQISIVLGIFFLLVILKNLKGDENKNIAAVDNIQNQVVTPSLTPVPTQDRIAGSTGGSNFPTQVPTSTPTPAGLYRNGSYTGSAADAFYGYIQVQAVISGGKITDVVFLQYPNDNGTSQYINSQAMPYLKEEALSVQSANVNIVSGASDSSLAFRQSLADALSQAK